MAKGKSYEMDIKIIGEIDKSLSSAATAAQKELQEIAAYAARNSDIVNHSFRNFDTRGIDALGNIADNAFGLVASGAKLAAEAIGGIAVASVMVGANFEEQMSVVQSISNVSLEEMKLLEDMAKQMGRSTKFSASEAGEAFEYMSMAGWKTEEMLDGINGVMDLAAASGESLALTSDIVTDAITAFGLSAKDTNHFVDVLAAASSNANTNVAMMGESFKYAAPLAGSFGFTIEDTALMLGMMANSGIKASQAGTSLRKIFTALSSEIKINQADGSLLTIQTSDQAGKMRDLRDIIDDVRAAFSGMSEEQRLAAQDTLKHAAQELSISLEDENGKLKTQAQLYAEISEGMQGLTDAGKVAEAEELAGKTGMAGLLTIINTSEEDYQKLADAIDNADGTAKRMAETRINNLKGDVTILKSGLEGVGVEIYDQLKDPLRDVVQGVTDFVNDDIVNALPTIRREMKQLGKFVSDGLDPLIDAGGWFLDNPHVLAGGLMGIGGALATFKAAQGVSHAVKSISNLSKLVSAWPVAVAGLAIGGIVGISTAIKTSNEKLKKENLAEHFGNISLSIEELQQVASDLLYTDSIGQITEGLEAMSEVDEIGRKINSVTKEINKANWKVEIGLELSEQEMTNYQANIQDFIQSSQDQVLQMQYATSLELNAFMGDDLQGQAIQEQFDAFYTSRYSELQYWGGRLGDVVAEAFSDHMLDPDEAKAIRKLQEKMIKMQSNLTMGSSNLNARFEVMRSKYGDELNAETFQNLQIEMEEQVQAKNAEAEKGYFELLDIMQQIGYSEEEYNKQKDILFGKLLTQQAENRSTAVNFQVDTIMQQYEKELGDALPEFEVGMQELLETALINIEVGNSSGASVFETFIDEMQKLGEKSGLEKDSIDAITALYEPLQKEIEELDNARSKLLELNIETPKSLDNAFKNVSKIGALVGDKNAILSYSANIISSSEYKDRVLEAYGAGEAIPEQFIKGIESREKDLDLAGERLHRNFIEKMQERFENPLNFRIPINLQTSITMQNDMRNIIPDLALEYETTSATTSTNIKGMQPERYAKGGLIENPTLSWFAEESPEMAIPINNSSRSVALWQETGRLLGIYKENNYAKFAENISQAVMISEANKNQSGNSGNQYIFSPVLNLNNDTRKEEFQEMQEEMFERFAEYMEQRENEKRRKSF